MSTDLRQKLELGAGHTGSAADIETAWTRGRKLRRRRLVVRASAGAVAASVLVVGALSLAAGGGHARPGRVAIADGGPASTLASQTTAVTSTAPTSTTVPTVTTLLAGSTTAPSPTPTTAPAGQPADAATDALIREAVLGWLDTKPPVKATPYVEDLASIWDAELAGAAQHSAADLAGFGGSVGSVTLVSPTEATVQYDVLHYGAVAIGGQQGTVKKIGGQWMVSRETACALLAQGGIQCPPRTG
jgi:hypothetical protein